MAWKKNTRGLVGTTIFHGSLIILMLFFGFKAPFPPPPEEGILVNFGTNDMGGGFVEPQRQQYTPPVVEEQEEVAPPVVEDPVEEVTDDAEQEAEDLLTQELEEAAAINAQKNREEEELRKKREEEERLRKEEEERQRQIELEKQRMEAERIRQAELERQRKEEEERQRKAAQDAQRNAISDRMQKSFGGKSESGSTNSEGVRGGEGNQGVTTGSTESDDHTMINSTGSGISYSLDGRSVVGALKKPDYPGQESGKVVVQITVDKDGRVVAAVPGMKGSTTLNTKLLAAAKKAAMTARFNKVTDPNAAINQKGTITYDFRLTGG